MNSEGIDKIRKIREKEEYVNRMLEEARQKCKDQLDMEREKAARELKEKEDSLQIRHDLAVRERRAQFERSMQAAMNEAKEKASLMKLDMDDGKIVETMLKVMDEYVSE
ncbi:MAG: hypothetical protein ACYCWK_06720 [Cuniculiplasma sp.]